MSDECKSFKNFQQSRARQPPFRQFCVELANDLKIEVVPPSMYESCSDNDGQMTIRRTDDGGDNTSSRVVRITYNKREAYFCKLPLIERRKNGRLNHQLVTSVKRQSSCVWCCRIDHSTGQKHSQHGMKTAWKCSVCGVSLCKRPRYNGQRCFLLFHEADTLFDPCSMQVPVERSNQGNPNPPPASRHRTTTTVSATTAEQPSASRNDNTDDDGDFSPAESSSGGDDDYESSPGEPSSRRRNISVITFPERRTRRRFVGL